MIIAVVTMLWSGYGTAGNPRVLKSTPAHGAKDVPADIGRMVIMFERNMKMTSWSLLETPDHPFPPVIQDDAPWQDPVTFMLRFERLKPGTTYGIQLNSEKRKGFLTAEDQVPLPVTTILFTTGKDTASSPTSTPGQGRTVFLTLHREQHQGAFHILIPKGWKAEGGMIPSGLSWNVVDLVENNIRFRVSSPDGKSFFGWYPRFYFQDPAVIAQSSMGVLRPQPGQVLNGCWLYPYMGLDQYVRHIVLGQLSAQEFQNPRILGAFESPELRPWVPRMASRWQCGHVNFTCTINGVPSYGRIYAILYELQGVIWTTVGTFGLIAPQDRWSEEEGIMEKCIRSFRLDPQWVQRAAAGQRYRAEKYGETIREMHRIDNEIQKNQSQTRSDIQEEFYKVITQQIETRDPQTGEMKWLPSYNHAYTDGRGNYVLKDRDDGTLPVDNATEWRKLQVINRNDPNYRPTK